jgi:hypothetical protein
VIPESRYGLKLSGDMFATLIGWLNDVDAGGGTAFTSSAVEKVQCDQTFCEKSDQNCPNIALPN